jgi:hypothetical protein
MYSCNILYENAASWPAWFINHNDVTLGKVVYVSLLVKLFAPAGHVISQTKFRDSHYLQVDP